MATSSNNDDFTSISVENEQEQWYQPAESDMDLDKMLKYMDENPDENDFIIKQDDIDQYQTTIADLRGEIESKDAVFSYLDDFEKIVRTDLLMIGSISMDEFQTQEQKLKEGHLEGKRKQIQEQQRKIANLARLTEEAKKRVWQELKLQQKEAAIREELLRKREKLQQDHLQKAFRQSENQLQHVLENRKADIKAFYGDLMYADNQYGGSKGRRWRVEWSKTPQPIQIKLKSVRGIRDKVPMGRYVLMVSLYDKLGGHVLRWSKLAGQQWGGATLPTHHDGSFATSEILLDQSVFTALPPQWKLQPGMVFTFELFLLRGSASPVDRVVAWGCFPVCDGKFQTVQGKYKVPMLRGHIEHRIYKHSTIEQLMASDIDHWMANLYIEIVQLPRYLSGQKEYEVELQFTSGLLSYPDRVANAEEAADGEKLPAIGNGNPESIADDSQSTGVSIKLGQSDYTSTSGIATGKESISDSQSVSTFKRRSFVMKSQKGLRKRHVKNKKKIDSSSEEEESNESSLEEDLIAVKGQEGMFYKVHRRNPVENYLAKNASLLVPQTPLLNKKTIKPKLTHAETLEGHSFSIQPPFTLKGKHEQSGHEKAEYIMRMFLSEMGFSHWKTMEFFVTILLLILMWFVRLYIHYCGQWVFIQALSLPVSTFVFFPYTVDLNYQADLLTTGEEIGVVVLGPFFNTIVQIIMVLIVWVVQLTLGSLPLIFSKVIMAFSLWTIFDPIAILIVDSILGRYVSTATQPIGDAFKLYWHFFRVEGSGVIGIPMTIFLYAVLMFTASVITYLYFLKLHNNGRMQDVFHRLHDDEEEFFVPYDLELSNQELSYIARRAEQWRGEDGERRKITVYDYIWEEDNDMTEKQQQEITTHIAVHTLHLDGLRELYRHFLRLPDGAIVEVLGDLGASQLSPDVKTALLKRSNNIENVLDSTVSLRENENIPVTVTHSSQHSRRMETLRVNFPERPVTSDSIKTRETIHLGSEDSNDENKEMEKTNNFSSEA